MTTSPLHPRSGGRRALRRTSAAAVIIAVVGACGAPGSDSPGTASGGPISTELPSEKITLKVISSENSGTTKALAAAFEKKHSNITVDLRYTAVDDYNKSLNLTLSSDTAPDLALLNMLGTTVKGNLVRDLDPYAKAYGWKETYPESQLGQWRATNDGKQLGIGKLWAAPAGFSVVGVYYNKELAAKLNISPPKTFTEFETALAKAKKAGEIPIQLGNLQGHSSFVVQSIVDAADGAEQSTRWAFGNPGSTLATSAGGDQAAKALADWSRKGYLSKGANGTDLPSSVQAFTKGEGLFLFDGNWDAAAIDKGMPGKAGFLPMPGATADAPATGIGTSVAYAIPSRAKNPDVAAAFLNFMNSPEAAQIQFKTGFMPVAHADTVKAPDGSVLADIATAWDKINKSNGLVPFFNNATPTMNDTLTSTGQQLIGGKISPKKYLEALQGDWEKGHQ